MSAFFKRGLLRDRQAGLVFYWRTLEQKDMLGCLLGLCAVFAVGVFLLYGFKIEVIKPKKNQSYGIQEVVIRQLGDPALGSASLAKMSSFDGWEPLDDQEVNERIYDLTATLFLSRSKRKIALLAPEESELEITKLSLLKPRGLQLPQRKYKAVKLPATSIEYRYVLEFSDVKLKERLMEVPIKKAELQWLGKSAQFVVSVAPSGEMVLCTPITELTIPEVEEFVRSLRFKSSITEGDQVTKVKVKVVEVGGD